MRRLAYILIALLTLVATQSCEMVSTFIHDGEVVASVGKSKLYRHDLESLIPAGLPSEDSLALAQQYINSWAADLVFLGAAQQKLSKNEKNLTKELEQYKNALLKYRYENLYINERLDTTVPDSQVEDYYENHKESLCSPSTALSPTRAPSPSTRSRRRSHRMLPRTSSTSTA